MLKKTWRFLTSMKFAILLLAVLTLACVFGSVIPQGGTLDEYLGAYGERGGALIVGLCLDDVFHSTWFLVLTVLLVCDLLYCNLIRLPSLLSRMKRFRDPQTAWRLSEAAQAFDEAGTPAGEEAEPKPARRRQEPAVCTVKQVPDAAAVFETLHMKPVPGERAGRKTLFAAQNSVGLWGAWVTHLGILLLIVGFTLGQTTRQLYTVHGVPGQAGFLSAGALSGRDDMQISVSGDPGRILLTARFDNLGKGASGAAIQNMNILLGADETEGLVIGCNE